ncbi:hypothetical protein PN462_08980 [Spirulina sp. CS-785/01]|uniref:hypothetical protein n=1 Tax=Spirulina sp. CS-785/01 TaxID=3021716 RepID=UPI00232C24A1|nr:hypothetical protein [Spirulina sp. CS-785/01]MDB9313231.1 hypothetical protein [Spirulina sp. CS-785/01]
MVQGVRAIFGNVFAAISLDSWVGRRSRVSSQVKVYAPKRGTNPYSQEENVRLALTRHGQPQWTEEDFQNLMKQLGEAGYGWLSPEGVRAQLEAMNQFREK